MFAEIDANGWTVIIAAVVVGLLQVLTLCFNFWREMVKARMSAEIARNVQQVKETQAKTVEDQASIAEEHGEKIDTLLHQTNGLSKRLADMSEAKGRRDQKDEDAKRPN